MEWWKGGRVEELEGEVVKGWKGWKGGRVEGWEGGRVAGGEGGRV